MTSLPQPTEHAVPLAETAPVAPPVPPAKPKSGRARVLLAIKALISVGLLGWVLYSSFARDGVQVLRERLSSLDVFWMVVAVVLQIVPVLLGTLRWGMLLDAQGLHLGYVRLLKSYLVGRFIAAFTPSTAGLDVYRAWDIARETGEMGKSTGAILVEKGAGLLAISLVCLATFPLGAEAMLGPSALFVVVAVASGSLFGLVCLAKPGLVMPFLRPLPGGIRTRATKLLEAVSAKGLTRLTLAKAIALGFMAHGCICSVFIATALALRLDVGLGALAVVGNVIVVSTLLPISVSGVGVRESVAVLLLTRVHVSTTDATLVALLGYLTGQVPAIAGGVLLAIDRRRPPATAPVKSEPAASSPRT